MFWLNIRRTLQFGRKPKPADCHHTWVVYATAFRPPCLELECYQCGVLGNVFDFSSEEWDRAFHAPSKPYRWREPERVTWTRQ